MKKTATDKQPAKTAKAIRKRPWNRVNLPVYSISSHDGNGHHNMHIITYVTAVSMQPKRFICAVYHGTQTLKNITLHPHFVLQLLSAGQYRLVNLLGRQSGKKIDKIARLHKRKELAEWNGFKILSNCLAVIELQAITPLDAGDHTLFLCDVRAYKNLHNGEALTLDILRRHTAIRI